MSEKAILCFGDSNTWGSRPDNDERFSRLERWPGVMATELGPDYYVIEEGLCGRTTVWDDPILGIPSGKKYLGPCLKTHAPLQLVILFLGTNDLKDRWSVTASEIAQSMGSLVEMVRKSEAGPGLKAPQILVVSPPKMVSIDELLPQFTRSGPKQDQLAAEYRLICAEQGCHFWDAAPHIQSSGLDGVHLEGAQQAKLGRLLADETRRILAQI